MWRWSLLPWLVALAASASATESALRPEAAQQVLLRCAEAADPGLAGLAALRDTCPQIDAAIRTLQLGAGLPSDWQTHVSAHALLELGALSAAYAGEPPRALPAPERLRDIARHLPAPEARLTLWQQLKRWLNSLVDTGDWWAKLKRFLTGRHTSSFQAATVFYSLVAGLVLTVVVIAVIELRAAGVFGKKRRAQPAAPSDQGAPVQAPDAPEDLGSIPARLRPALLLRRLVTVLTELQRLGHERDLTCRELITTARFDSSAQRERFAALALLAEGGLYGPPHEPPPPQAEAVLADARGLSEQLQQHR